MFRTLAATLIGLVPLASAQELPLRITQVEDRTVVMMPAAGRTPRTPG